MHHSSQEVLGRTRRSGIETRPLRLTLIGVVRSFNHRCLEQMTKHWQPRVIDNQNRHRLTVAVMIAGRDAPALSRAAGVAEKAESSTKAGALPVRISGTERRGTRKGLCQVPAAGSGRHLLLSIAALQEEWCRVIVVIPARCRRLERRPS